MNDLLHEPSKQLTKIVKPMVCNEIQMIQQQKEASHEKEYSAKVVYGDMPEVTN